MSLNGFLEFNIDENFILREVPSQDALAQGTQLFLINKIKSLSFFPEDKVFRGIVNDSGINYTAELKFNNSGNPRSYRCTCSEYFKNNRACSHITAIMKWMVANIQDLRKKRYSTNVVPLLPLVNSLAQTGNDRSSWYQNNAQVTHNRVIELRPPANLPVGPNSKPNDQVVEKLKLSSDAKELFEYISSMNSDITPALTHDKQKVKLVASYHVDSTYRNNVHWLDFSTGINKQYIVKNIIEYVNSYLFKRKLNFGKSFEYDPQNMEFDTVSRKLADLLVRICMDKNKLHPSGYQYYGTSNENRRIELSNSRLLEFMDIIAENNLTLDVKYNAKEFKDVSIINGTPPIKMQLKRVDGGLKLDFGLNKGELIKLDFEGLYLLFNSSIYKLDQDNARIMVSMTKYLKAGKEQELTIPDSEVSRFHSAILPSLEKVSEVKIHESVKAIYIREDLHVSIYLDRVQLKKEDGISARVEFGYSDILINPLVNSSNNFSEGKLLIRNDFMETAIINSLKNSGFFEEGSVYCLTDEQSIFGFVYDKLPILNEATEIYYSDAFKALKLQGSFNMAAGIKLSSDGNLLELTLTHEGLDAQELTALLSAYKLKKRYYKLRNGSFLPLDNSQAGTLAKIVESLDLTDKDLREKTVMLPKYRAMYLDSLTREESSFHVERSSNFKNLVQSITEPQDLEYEVPESLKGILRDYQKIGFKWLNVLSDFGMGGILADDMGLGKTLQVLTFLLHRKNEYQKRTTGTENTDFKPSIVIAPTSLVFNWDEEVNKFTKGLNAVVVSGPVSERQQLAKVAGADLVITSYALIKRDIEFYKDMDFSYCFLDEAQHIKNPATLNAQTVKMLKAKTCFALTGTPIENSLTELWSVFDFLMPGYLYSHGKFSRVYETPIIKNQDKKTLKELGRHIRPFIMRRMKKDVLKELPEKTETRMTCSLDETQKKLYLAYLMKAKKVFEAEINTNGYEKSHIKILALLTRLRQICCHPSMFIENYDGGSGKTDMFFELIEDAVEGGHRVLAFSQFTGMLRILRKTLDANKTGYFYLDGSTDPKDRIAMVNAFNRGEHNLFLISMKAGGTGLNLTGADTVIHLDPWWNPAVEDQATDRAYRIGQKNSVSVYKLVTKDTIEEKIFELQKKKRELVDLVIKPGENFLSKMSVDDVRSLFE